MKRLFLLFLLCATTLSALAQKDVKKRGYEPDCFPDGTVIDPWFTQAKEVTLDDILAPRVYVGSAADQVIDDSTVVQTEAIQRIIDLAGAQPEGAVVVFPRGTYLTGALQMRQGVSLYLDEGAVIKGSSDISDYPIVETRIEGQTCKYFSALINANGIRGLRIFGKGKIDGNGLPFWKAFWLRRSWNPQCTNKDEQRPRLVYLSNCSDAEISGLTLQNSPFWTTHLYRCDHVRLLNLRILSPAEPVKAPSTDAIDIDACHDIHVKGCYMAVNDDAIALKGGKGPYADQDPNNGANERIIIEDCEYGFCHGCLTCGSESIHNRNIILRRIKVGKATRLLWLKMRPDTPQQYEYITVEDITGDVTHFLFVRPWTQFFDLQGRTDMPQSYGEHITMRRCQMRCQHFFSVERSDQYRLSHFTFENLDITAEHPEYDKTQIDQLVQRKVKVEKATTKAEYTDTTQQGDVNKTK